MPRTSLQELARAYLADPARINDLLEGVIRELWNPLLRVISRYVKRDAEDLVQEVFIKVIPKISKAYKPEQGDFKNWFFSVAKNAALDELRRRKRQRKAMSEYLADVADPTEAIAPTDEEITELEDISARNQAAMQKALASLEPMARDVFRLHFEDHWKPGDLATVLSMNAPEISKWLYTLNRRVKKLARGEGYRPRENKKVITTLDPKALADLPLMDRDIYLWHFQDHAKVGDIAKMLSLPPRTVSKWLSSMKERVGKVRFT